MGGDIGIECQFQGAGCHCHNLANVNTVGYKSSKTYFSDVLSSTFRGSSASAGRRGVAVADDGNPVRRRLVRNNRNATDVAIAGDGFFMVTTANGATFYTRADPFIKMRKAIWWISTVTRCRDNLS
jgi:flagellar hook-basal body protein